MSYLPKTRKLGIRFRKQTAREWGFAVPNSQAVELFDIQSGEKIEGIIEVRANFDAQQVTVDLRLFVAQVDCFERPEEHLQPVKD